MDTSAIIPLISIFFLVLVSAFFSGSETALTASSRARIHKLKTEGNKRARMVGRLLKNKDRLIGTLLLGNNAVNILASALATSFAITYFGDNGVLYSTLLMTAIVLVFAEVLPKTYAFHNSERVALRSAPIMVFLVKVLYPITGFVQAMVDLFLKFFGLEKSEEVMSDADELRGAIELSHHEGGVKKRDKDMLGSILDLAETEVKNIMIHRKNMNIIDADLPIGEIVNQVMDSAHTRIPIFKDKSENIVGILHAKDLLKEIKAQDGKADNIDILQIAAKPWFVPETNTLSNQLLQFRQKRSHLAMVVDEYGDIVGLVTLEDVLEEIVGQIYDEHDVHFQGIKKLKDGSYKFEGDVPIRDINRQLDWNIPDKDASTIAGFLINKAEKIPDAGQSFEFDGFVFKILRKKKNQITSLKVRKLPTDSEE